MQGAFNRKDQAPVIVCRREASLEPFLDPGSERWAGQALAEIEMIPAPLGLQPNDYIVVSWEDRDYGELDFVRAGAVHDGERIALIMTWASAAPNTGANEGFSDSAAIGWPVRAQPDLHLMGTPDAPMHFLQWMARGNIVRSASARGIGTSEPAPEVGESIKAGWSGGAWTVVFARNLAGGDGTASLAPGSNAHIGFAVWNGGNEERAGIKAVAAQWTTLALAP